MAELYRIIPAGPTGPTTWEVDKTDTGTLTAESFPGRFPDTSDMQRIFQPGTVTTAGVDAPIGETKMADISREEFEAKLQNVELKTDLKFEKLSSKLDLIVAGQTTLTNEVSHVRREISANRGIYVTLILAVGLAMGGLIIGLLAYGAAVLDMAAGIFSAGQNSGTIQKP